MKLKKGNKIIIPFNLTTDPYNKRGETGTIIDIKKDTVKVKFSDGSIGYYIKSIWENYNLGGTLNKKYKFKDLFKK